MGIIELVMTRQCSSKQRQLSWFAIENFNCIILGALAIAWKSVVPLLHHSSIRKSLSGVSRSCSPSAIEETRKRIQSIMKQIVSKW